MASAHDACWKATSNALKFLSLQVILARPLPWLACKMNALATWFTCQWLMGPSKVNDVETDDGKVRCAAATLTPPYLFVWHRKSLLLLPHSAACMRS